MSENQLKMVAGIKKDFVTFLNNDNNVGLGDKASWQVRINISTVKQKCWRD